MTQETPPGPLDGLRERIAAAVEEFRRKGRPAYAVTEQDWQDAITDALYAALSVTGTPTPGLRGEDIRIAIATATPLNNPRLSEVEWDDVARLLSRYQAIHAAITGAVTGTPTDLDAAWAQAEAALPEGFYVRGVIRADRWGSRFQALATPDDEFNPHDEIVGKGDTQAEALNALTALLRGEAHRGR